MKERLVEFLKYLGIGQLKFEEKVGLSRGYVNKIGDNITLKTLDKIAETYPELDIHWLRSGNGEMLKSKTSSKIRLKSVLEEKNVNLSELCKKTNIPIDILEQQINGNLELTLDTVIAINNVLKNIGLQWLLKGTGNKYIDRVNTESETKLETIQNPETKNYKLIPLINLDVVGGVSNKEMDIPQFVERYIPFVGAIEGDICCAVTNNSMSPVYPPGTLVQLRKIALWRQYIEFGQVYVVDLIDGRRLIKQVKKGSCEERFVLASFNTQYDDNEIPIDMIYTMWLVIAKYEKVVM